MKLVRIFILITLNGLLSCGEETQEEPTKLPFFTLAVEPSYLTDASENWVLASTPEGEWLDLKPFESGQTITLESSRSDIETFFVHFLSIIPTIGESYNLESYGDVPNSFTWTLKAPEVIPTRSAVGSFTLKIPNYPHSLSDDRIIFSDGISRNYTGGSQSGSQANFGLNLYTISDEKSSIFISSFRNNLPVYLFLRDLSLASTTITKDFDLDFSEVENILQINFPGNTFLYCQITGFFNGMDTDREGFIISEFIDWDGGAPAITLGYTNQFDTYRSVFSTTQNNLSRTYEKLGSPLSSINFPNVNINIENSDIENFAASIDSPFDYFNSEWRASENQNFLNWSIKSKQSEFIIKTMPEQITNEYPFLKTVIPNLHSIGFTQALDDYNYENLINNRFSRPTHYYFFGLSF